MDNPRVRRDPLRDLVHVVLRGETGTDVQELFDAVVAGEFGDGTARRVTVVAYIEVIARIRGEGRGGGAAVGLVLMPPQLPDSRAEMKVPAPGVPDPRPACSPFFQVTAVWSVPASRIGRHLWPGTAIFAQAVNEPPLPAPGRAARPLPTRREGRTVMPARTTRTRLLAAAAVLVAALSLTACEDGEGVRDEGPSATETGTTGDATGGATGAGRSTAPPKTAAAPCTTATTKVTVVPVPRPLNHVLLTATNTGKKVCTLPGFPEAGFGPDRLVTRPVTESKPAKPVKLAPGERGYAGMLLSSADGSGKGGSTAKALEITVTGGGAAAKPVTVTLPEQGVYVDDSAVVTYWQGAEDTALAW